MSFYKTEAAEPLAAWAEFEAKRDELFEKSKAFAASFGGRPAYYRTPWTFAGVAMPAPINIGIWRNPKDGITAPRRKPRKGASEEDRRAIAELCKRWDAEAPAERVDMNPVLKSLGHCWSDFFFSGLHMFAHDGALYAKSSVTGGLRNMTEILGSEYDAARAAHLEEGHANPAP